VGSLGKENALAQKAPGTVSKPATATAAAADAGEEANEAAGSGWKQRGPKTMPAVKEAVAQRQCKAEGNQTITRWLKPSQEQPPQQQQAHAQQQQQQTLEGAVGAGPSAGSSPAGSSPAGSSPPATAAEAAVAAVAASPGDSELDLHGLAAEVAANAATVGAAAAAAASGAASDSSAGGAIGDRGGQLTPQQPAQAAAPRTDRVPVSDAAEEAAAVASKLQRGAAAGEDLAALNVPAQARGRKGWASGGGSGLAPAGRKRAAATAVAGGADTPAAANAAVDTDGAAGSNKRSKKAAAAVAAGAAPKPRRKSTPAAAGAGAETPAPIADAGAAAGAASTGAADSGGTEGSGRRRIPARLLPWNCGHCTFENQASCLLLCPRLPFLPLPAWAVTSPCK
jgi:hypothetical protein